MSIKVLFFWLVWGGFFFLKNLFIFEVHRGHSWGWPRTCPQCWWHSSCPHHRVTVGREKGSGTWGERWGVSAASLVAVAITRWLSPGGRVASGCPPHALGLRLVSAQGGNILGASSSGDPEQAKRHRGAKTHLLPSPQSLPDLGDRMGRDGAGGWWPQFALTPPTSVGPRAFVAGNGDGDRDGVGTVP